MSTTNSVRQFYVNLPVRDPKKSTEFFTKLGFEFNPKFSDENAACMIINQDACVMLLRDSYFKTFTQKEIADTSRSTEGLFAISCPSKTDVEDTVKRAIAGGATPADE